MTGASWLCLWCWPGWGMGREQRAPRGDTEMGAMSPGTCSNGRGRGAVEPMLHLLRGGKQHRAEVLLLGTQPLVHDQKPANTSCLLPSSFLHRDVFSQCSTWESSGCTGAAVLAGLHRCCWYPLSPLHHSASLPVPCIPASIPTHIPACILTRIPARIRAISSCTARQVLSLCLESA